MTAAARVHTAHGSMIGMVSCVPATEWVNEDIPGAVQVEKMTGIKSRRRVVTGQDTEFLCSMAANRLMRSIGWSPETVSLLVVVTQTPSQRIPATGYRIHQTLGLPEWCMVMEVNWSCAGYVLGLLTAMKMNTGRALLLVGDTVSELLNRHDRATSPIFGDAGSATAIEHTPSTVKFVLGSDGSGSQSLHCEHHGSLFMAGDEVFNMTLDRVPPMVDSLLLGESPDAILFHQANLAMLRHLTRKMRLFERFPGVKIPTNIEKYGNTSCCSIPLLMCDRADMIDTGHKVAMFGFGGGWAWAGALLTLEHLKFIDLIEV